MHAWNWQDSLDLRAVGGTPAGQPPGRQRFVNRITAHSFRNDGFASVGVCADSETPHLTRRSCDTSNCA